MKKPSIPKYHRQRFLLALLELTGKRLSKRDMQKLLFLANYEAGFDYFNFVPFHYGCYSFQAQSDIELMAKVGWLHETEKQLRLNHSTAACIDDAALAQLNGFLTANGKMRGNKLLKYVYESYPYYATRSRIADTVLDKTALNKIEAIKNKLHSNTQTLFTIGYEGLSFEAYVNRLIEHDIRLLCDVRKNPLSRKFGFSKSRLSVLLPKLGVTYEHIPELGIPSEYRQSLHTANDYAKLFMHYRKQLPTQSSSLEQVEQLLKKYKRIALTCFEKEHTSCHRHCVSELLEKKGIIRVYHL